MRRKKYKLYGKEAMRFRKNVKLFIVLLINFHIATSAFAMECLGQPTFPIPFDNNQKMGCCHQNAVLQCLLQCPEFCSFIDRIKKPKNELLFYIKRLRENLKLFTCDEKVLMNFFNSQYYLPDAYELRTLIAGCSTTSCLYIQKYMKNACIKDLQSMCLDSVNYMFIYEYLLLKKIFGLKAFYYLNEQHTVFSLKKIEFDAEKNEYLYIYSSPNKRINVLNSHGFDFVYFYVPTLDLFVVKRTSGKGRSFDLSCNVAMLHDIVTSLESFFTQDTGKTFKLRALDFATEHTLRFIKRPGCAEALWSSMLLNESLWVNGKLSDLVDSVVEVPSDTLIHCAAYVNHNNMWYFCDDFFRECLGRPLIRRISENTNEMLADLIHKEQGGYEVLFFCADS